MRSFSGTALSYLQSRNGYVVKSFLWVKARNRTTGAIEPLGVWTGDEDRSFTIGAESRIYAGEGALMPLDPIQMTVGLAVRFIRVRLNPLDATVAQLLRGTDAGLAAAELHRGFFDPLTGILLEEPHRVFKGWVHGAPITTPAAGGEAVAELTLASSAQALMKTLSLKKSDAVQSLRGGDQLRRYEDVSGSVPVWWGARRHD